jgi:hypothetical protein
VQQERCLRDELLILSERAYCGLFRAVCHL